MEKQQLVWVLIILASIAAVIVHELRLLREPYLLLATLVILATYTTISLLRREKPGVEYIVLSLMLFVGILTYIFGLHVEGSLVLGLFAVAEILEEYAEERAEKNLYALMEYMPKRAKRILDGDVVEVDVKEVKSGDIVLVGRGDRVPVDGVVIEGSGSVDQSIITGEPLPMSVKQHSFVYAGSLVVGGAFKVRALTSGDQSLFTRLVSLIDKYKESRTQFERFIHRFSKIYLPLMLIFAFIAWLTLDIRVALVVIAIACPSAFLVSISTTFLTSLAILARRGILSKGTPPIERASKIGVIAFDKTGTLTLGKPQVEKIIVYDENLSEYDLLRLAASIEVASSHPLARAIVDKAQSMGLKLLDFKDIRELPGMGIVGKVDSNLVAVGSRELMDNIGVNSPGNIEIRSPHVYVANNNQLIGLITFSDRINPESKRLVKELKRMKYRVVMLTGDKRVNAEKISSILGIDEFYAELNPEDKVRLINDLKTRYRNPVAMVGDGINDAPALAVADLGIAVGSLQAAIEAGDVALTSGSLENILYFFKLSREAFRKTVENITVITAAKAAVIILSILGLIPLWIAVAIGDDGALLLALINTFIVAGRK